MNKTLASMFVIAALSMGAAPAFAQSTTPAPDAAGCHHARGGGPFSAEHMERRITHLTQRLSLDAHQVTLVRGILTSSRTQAEALRTGTPGPERRTQFHALMQSTRSQIDAVLNDAQRAQFAQMQTEMRGRMHGRRGHHGGHAPGATPPSGDARGI